MLQFFLRYVTNESFCLFISLNKDPLLSIGFESQHKGLLLSFAFPASAVTTIIKENCDEKLGVGNITKTLRSNISTSSHFRCYVIKFIRHMLIFYLVYHRNC